MEQLGANGMCILHFNGNCQTFLQRQDQPLFSLTTYKDACFFTHVLFLKELPWSLNWFIV